MDFSLEIRIGTGLSDLEFGSSMSEVEKLLGKADKVENINDVEEYPTIVWHYDEIGVSLFFDAKNTRCFVCADIENAEAMLWEEAVFNFTEKRVIELFKSKGIYLYEIEQQEWGENRLSFEEANIDFYFVKNKLISINYGIIAEGTQTLILPN